ncbi:MAG: SCO1664 family protein [Chloroflexi bacterium]|nr:SCO1664 family protein [Chloroflexota bacterium]
MPEPVSVSMARVVELLRRGNITLQGMVPWSSNYTFLVSVQDAELQALAVYKPSRGERYLWDFEAGTLCRREVAAYVVSQYLGWPDIPPVVLREGPEGIGTVQLFIETDWDEHFFTLREDPAHEETFRRLALFDYIVNNADRKGGHVMKGRDGRIWAIDHGLTFHVDYKLRTVIWDYAGQPIAETLLKDLALLREQAMNARSPLARALLHLLDRGEIKIFGSRIEDLLRSKAFPRPRRGWRNVPYPLV